MARALSEDLRSRVLAAAESGMSARGAAARFGIGITTAISWIASARQGQRHAAKQGKPTGSSLDAHEGFMVNLIKANPDLTLDEMVERLEAERGVKIGRSAVNNWLRKHGWTYKKRPAMHWSKNVPT